MTKKEIWNYIEELKTKRDEYFFTNKRKHKKINEKIMKLYEEFYSREYKK